jgi:hypothetical protein
MNRFGRVGVLAVVLAGVLLVAGSVGGLTATTGDRGANAGVVDDSTAYLAIAFEDACPVVVTLTNTHSVAFDGLVVTAVGGDVVSAPAGLAPGESGVVEVAVVDPAPAVVSLRILATGAGVTVDADREYVVESECAPDVGVRTQGYWKTHAEAWPVDDLELGGETYGASEALALLWSPPAGDAALVLFHQAVAATLNAENGAPADRIEAVLADANAWLAANPPGTGVTPGSPTWTGEGEALKNELDAYNDGTLCALAED